MKCQHEYNEQGIMPAANLMARCKKCGQEYYCDEKGKPHLIELLGTDEYKIERQANREIIIKKDK
jgi:hypothetical protein